MWIKRYWFLLLFTQLAFSQSEQLPLEEKIYFATKTFQENQNNDGLKKLESFEKSNSKTIQSSKNKAVILEYVFLSCSKAFYQKQIGAHQDAIKSYEKAWQLYDKNKIKSDFDIIEYCLKPLGNLYTIIGDYENAENIIKQYFYIATIQVNSPESSAHKYAAILNLSNIYQSTGKVSEAIDLLEKTIKTESLSTIQKGNLYTNLGNNYLVSTQGFSTFNSTNLDKAENAYLKSISLLKNDKTQIENLSKTYRNLSQLKLNSDIKAAINYFEKAKIEFSKLSNIEPRTKAKFYLEEANLLFKQQKLTEANNKILEVFKVLIPNYDAKKSFLPNKNSLYTETTFLDAFDLQAALFLAKNQPKKALECHQLSFHVENLFQSVLVYENSKIITQVRNRNRTEKCIEIYYQLYQKEKKISYIVSAFLLSENTKSAVLKDYLSNSKTISRQEKTIRKQLQDWNNIILREQKKGNYADISKINEAIKKQNELMLLLKSKTSEETKETKPLEINDLFSKLKKDNSTLVEYFFGQNKIYIFTIVNGKITLDFIRNDATSITKIKSFIDYFSDSEKIINNVAAYNNDGFSLYQLLKLPKKSNTKNLVIIPDGILTFLPFEALITKESVTTNFAKMHYLLKKFRIGYNNSATFYLNSIPFKHDKETVLGVFPIFENTNLELAFSKKEMEAIQKKFKGKYLSKTEATFENFTSNASSFSILHLSTHADSGDIIDPASIKFINNEILYSELYNLEVHPDLVVLSACETGIGKLYKAEGAMSIARGFQFAGAQNLLFSLWKVNDFTTSVLMTNFYTNISKNQSYFDAIHNAKLNFLKDNTIPSAKKSPYYWSAFVYYGTLENKSSSSSNYFFWISIVGGLIGLFLLFKLFKKWKNSKRL
ncbi:CHAT domain-containing protein [Flavobacterium sp.]|uniref:CHAT domain-containing protein n=1 Tax=Flavobacterium sp. TaxID=239 RepID=UPI00263369F3|nr:CHAT domain-containing protein [Flavobacterium sp.]